MRVYLFLFSIIILPYQLFAQIKLNTSRTEYGKTIQKDEIPYLTKGIEQLLLKYISLANLYDPGSGEVSADKMEEFGKLFTSDAKVCPDYLALANKESSLMGFVDYSLDIFERMNKNGLPFTLTDAVLEKIDYTTDASQYISVITFTKKLEIGCSPDNRIIHFKNGRKMTQQMTLVAEKTALTDPLILKIALLQVTDAPEITGITLNENKPKESVPDKPNGYADNKKNTPPAPPTPDPVKPNPPVEKPTPPVNTDPPPPVVVKPAHNLLLDISSAKIDTKLPSNLRGRTFDSLEVALQQYIKYGTLLDPQAGKVTDSWLEHFDRLFSDQAKIYNDLAELEPEFLINFEEYITLVYENLSTSGVKFRVTSAKLESVTQEFEGFYKATVLIDKSMFHYLGKGRDRGLAEIAAPPNAPRVYPLRIRYSFNAGGAPKIDGIESSAPVCAREKEEKFVSGYGRFGISLLSAAAGDFWLNNFSKDQLAVTATSTIGGGIQYSSNTFYNDRKCKKPFFWTLGVSYYQTNLTTEVKDWLLRIPVDVSYANEVSFEKVRQVNSIKIAEGILGVRYRVLSNFNTTVFIDASALPSYIVAGSYNFEADNSSLILHDGIITARGEETRLSELPQVNGESFFQVYETESDNTYMAGYHPVNAKPKTDFESALGLSARLGLSIYKKLGYSWGIIGGLDFNYNILSPVVFNNREEAPFLTPADIATQGSLLQDYVKKTNQHSIGARLGFYYRLSK